MANRVKKQRRDKKSNTCKTCENSFSPSRWDQKYCSIQCKNEYNNKRKSKAYHLTKEINDILLKNRNILRCFYTKKEVYRKELEEAGFHLSYHTHSFLSTDSTKHIYFVYDFGIQELLSNKFKIHYHGKIQIDQSV